MRCIRCGSTALAEGTIVWGKNEDVSFKPSDQSKLLHRVFWGGTRPVRAYGCIRCGHLQLMVDFRESDRERYQQFEGPQPSVLERLDTESEEPEQ